MAASQDSFQRSNDKFKCFGLIKAPSVSTHLSQSDSHGHRGLAFDFCGHFGPVTYSP